VVKQRPEVVNNEYTDDDDDDDDYDYDYDDDYASLMPVTHVDVAGLSVSQGVHCYSGPYDGDNGRLLANAVGT